MFPDIRPGTAADTRGWTCIHCGGWVGDGMSHVCPNLVPTAFDFTAGNPIGTVELRQKLDDIAELLRRIVRKIGA